MSRELASEAVTYDAVGATLVGVRPPGFHLADDRVPLDGGAAAFAAGRVGLQQWRAHLGAGLDVQPREAPAAGATVVAAARLGPFTAIAPCRVVAVVDDDRRAGFAYGTLPGHP